MQGHTEITDIFLKHYFCKKISDLIHSEIISRMYHVAGNEHTSPPSDKLTDAGPFKYLLKEFQIFIICFMCKNSNTYTYIDL